MKKTLNKKTPTIDEISEMAAEGKDVSEYFTKKFRVRQPLEKDQTINLSMKSANVFFNAIENPPKPSKKLKDAMKAYRKSFGQKSS